MKVFVAYLGDPAVKDKYLSRVRAHRAADQIVKGKYWENGKGCAIGCTIHGDDHEDYESKLGIPRIIAHLEDALFERLPNGKAMEWPEKFLEAITPGVDLSLVWPKFIVWLLVDPQEGVIQFCKTESGKTAVRDVADAYQSVIRGENKKIDWLELRRNAADAADAAYAAKKQTYEETIIRQSEKLLELLREVKPVAAVA